MAETKDTNQTLVIKWALLNLRLVGGYRNKVSPLAYFNIFSMFMVIAFMVTDLMLNFTGIESLRRITFLPSFFVSGIKGVFLLLSTKKLKAVINNLRHFWRLNKFDVDTETQIRKTIRNITLLSGGYSFSAIAVCTLMLCSPLTDLETKTLPYSDFTFCNLQTLSCWIPMYIWQCCAILVQLMPSAIAFDCFFVSFVGYVTIACKLLNVGLQKLNTDDVIKRRFVLKEIVKQHDFMMQFLNSVNNMFTVLLMLQFWCSLWSMILFLNMMVADGLPPKIADVSYFGTLYAIIFMQIFIYASGGAIVEEQVRNLSTDMFMVNWYGRNRTDLRKDLTLMIFRAQQTKLWNVGKMSDLNYALFIATVKNSMSVFTLIWQLDNQ